MVVDAAKKLISERRSVSAEIGAANLPTTNQIKTLGAILLDGPNDTYKVYAQVYRYYFSLLVAYSPRPSPAQPLRPHRYDAVMLVTTRRMDSITSVKVHNSIGAIHFNL